MNEWTSLIAAFWAVFLLDCIKLSPAGWRRFLIGGFFGRTPRKDGRSSRKERRRERRRASGGDSVSDSASERKPPPPPRAIAHVQSARVLFGPPPPFAWQAFSDDLPFSFSPEGICNVSAGAAGRPAPEPAVARSWRWEDIKSVEKKGARIFVNDRDFCAVTGYAGAAGLWALAQKCALLPPDARGAFLERRAASWFRPAHLRRALVRVNARTATLAFFATFNAVLVLAVSLYFLLNVPELAGDFWARRIARMLPAIGLYAAGLHVVTLLSGWLAIRRLLPRGAPQRGSMLAGAAFLPPHAFRLRAQIAAAALPAQHPLAWFALTAGGAAFRKRAFDVLADLRWPIAPPRIPDPEITARITAWMRGCVAQEIARLLEMRGVSEKELLAPPAPDSAQSCAYCPRCRDQFSNAAGHCACGVGLLPLGDKQPVSEKQACYGVR